MTSHPWNPLGNRPCKQLRSKEMFYDVPAPREEDSTSGIFWCNHTQNCLGPDDKPAGIEDCDPQRRCYEQ